MSSGLTYAAPNSQFSLAPCAHGASPTAQIELSVEMGGAAGTPHSEQVRRGPRSPSKDIRDSPHGLGIAMLLSLNGYIEISLLVTTS